MIYTDGVHLVSTDLEELHVFAKKIGLKRCWFQGTRRHRFPHYDLTTPHKSEVAIQSGAVFVTSRQLVSVLMRTKIPLK